MRHSPARAGITWADCRGVLEPCQPVASRDGHQFQRPNKTTVDGINRVRTKKVSSNIPAQMLKPIC